MELVYVVVLCFVSAFAGAFLTGRWYRADVERYKDLYLKVADEKKNLIVEYGRRLDDFGRLVGSNSIITGSLGTSTDRFEDSEYM